MDVLIDYAYREQDLRALPLEELARFVMEAEEVPESAEVSLAFVTDDEIAVLNEEYRGKIGPTDVLSFECDGLDDEFSACAPADADVPFELGDLVLAPDVAQRQTALYGTTFESEITLLVVHGMLHLCGYDHIEDDEAEEMEARERELLGAWADLGYEEARHVRDDTIRVRGEH